MDFNAVIVEAINCLVLALINHSNQGLYNEPISPVLIWRTWVSYRSSDSFSGCIQNKKQSHKVNYVDNF